MIYVVLIYLLKKTVAPGWTTLSLQQGGMFFILFLVLTVTCEYIGRIRLDSMERPIYWVRDEVNSNVLIEDPSRLDMYFMNLRTDKKNLPRKFKTMRQVPDFDIFELAPRQRDFCLAVLRN